MTFASPFPGSFRCRGVNASGNGDTYHDLEEWLIKSRVIEEIQRKYWSGRFWNQRLQVVGLSSRHRLSSNASRPSGGRVMSRTGPTMAADSKRQTPIASFQSMKSGSKRLLDYHISVIALLLWYYTHQSAVEVTDVSVLFPFACTSWNHSDGRICSSFSSIKQPSGFELHHGSASLPSFTRYYWMEYWVHHK